MQISSKRRNHRLNYPLATKATKKNEAKNLCIIKLPDISHRIHGTGVFAYIWWIFMVKVGKYCGYMEHLGFGRRQDPTRFKWPKIPLNSLFFIHLSGNRTLRPWCLAMHSLKRRKKTFGMAERIWFESLPHEIHIKFIEDFWGIQLYTVDVCEHWRIL